MPERDDYGGEIRFVEYAERQRDDEIPPAQPTARCTAAERAMLRIQMLHLATIALQHDVSWQEGSPERVVEIARLFEAFCLEK